MNLVQSTIESYLRQGMSQALLAKELGVSGAVLNYTLRGKREPSPKLLAALGIVRTTVYTYGPSQPVIEHKPKRARKRRVRRLEQMELPGVEPIKRPVMQSLDNKPKLSLDCVSIAVNYHLNPRATWDAFLADTEGAFCDPQSFEAFCAKQPSARQPSQASREVLYAAIGRGDAVPIQPQPERKDMRTPLQVGQLRPVVAEHQPEAK